MAEENGSASGSSDAESDPSNDAGRSAKVATTQMCPLGLRFSQRKMRNLFADGKLLSDTVDMVRPIRRTPSEVEIYGAEWKLEAPFPPIEVLRWRCKLRDETTGRPMIDPKTGEEMFDDEESWFTLDNRRLCCLQKAAVKLWPERCTCDVVAEIPKGARRMREIRKFRTLDAGKSVMVGSKVDGVPFTQWAWHAEVSKKLGGGGGGGGKGTGGKSRKGRGRGGGAGSSATAEDTDNAGYGESGGDGGAYQTSKGGKKGGGKARGKGYGYSGWGGGKGKGRKGRDQTASRAADAWVNQDPAIVAASASAAADYGDYYAEEAAESGYGYGYYDGGKAASGKGSKSRGRGGLNAYDAKGGYSDRARKGSGKKGGGRKGAAAV